uniref:Uncharacterized protein n=1 Tax=Candidatus Kentrum sp. LPFa TaxID=2126335 RepID=A0A450X886_9GAMM|nr:MAG: hypothetical protein BECKLPF1236A_GA0070988_1002425 [Candidatus Kentron sp. LPFa]VFK25529.1 MAG: hypothetical protein BECKLPF1236C_GA0070990_1002227 [Candidatus Kentron sp. LPFa]
MLLRDFQLYIHTRSQIKLHQRINCFISWINDIHKPLMGSDLVLIPRVFINVRRNQDRKTLFPSRQRNWSANLSTRPFSRIYNFLRRLINQSMIKSFQSNAYTLISHSLLTLNTYFLSNTNLTQ